MSPVTTLMNWGSSSMLNFRSTRPTGVTRGSFLILKNMVSLPAASINWVSSASAPSTMLRNFNISKLTSLIPMRSAR
jgi:hypothetical protein